MIEKKQRGGKRVGAGRKTSSIQKRVVSFWVKSSIDVETKNKIKEFIKSLGL